jgi:hypothetical protein
MRLGWCPRTLEQVNEIATLPRGQDVYLSPGDAGRFFVRALEADLPAGHGPSSSRAGTSIKAFSTSNPPRDCSAGSRSINGRKVPTRIEYALSCS